MLAYNEKNDAIICVRGQCLSYAVPKNAAGQHLGRADEVLHFIEGDFDKAQADKKGERQADNTSEKEAERG